MAVEPTRSVGRPRDPNADPAILDAARAVLRDRGYAGLRISEVAARAGVTPPTVRLRWPSKPELVHDALFPDIDTNPIVDTGSLESDLHELIGRTIRRYQAPELRSALLGFHDALRTRPDLRRRLGARVYGPAVEAYGDVLQRAIARGEIDAASAPGATTLVHVVAGSVLGSVLLYDGDLASLEKELVRLLVRGLGVAPEPAGRA